jgi:hypothetical protein
VKRVYEARLTSVISWKSSPHQTTVPAEHRYQPLDGEVYVLTTIAKAAAIGSRIGSPEKLSQFHDEISPLT